MMVMVGTLQIYSKADILLLYQCSENLMIHKVVSTFCTAFCMYKMARKMIDTE
jgi:hypothetical protein